MSNHYLSVSSSIKELEIAPPDKDPYLESVLIWQGRSPHFRNVPTTSISSTQKDILLASGKRSGLVYRSFGFAPEEGMKINVIGRIQPMIKWSYSTLSLKRLSQSGVGGLGQSIEQLKKKLTG